MDKLIILDASEKVPFLQEVICKQGYGDVAIEILEAGCGQRWLIKLGDKKFVLTGIDLDKEALEIRRNSKKDLDIAIHGDLRTATFERTFDVIYSAFVLEHIAGADDVLKRMVNWLSPNGVIVIEIPDPDSVKGLVTRITPHWFHILYYRVILGIETAGAPGHGPYRTYFDSVVSRKGIREFCMRNGLRMEAELAFATEGPRSGVMRTLIGTLTKAISILSLGVYSDRHADLLYVLRRAD